MTQSSRYLTLAGVFLFVAGLSPAALAQSITATVSPSRTSGVAPLAVFFDATATTHTDSNIRPFHDLSYVWDFADAKGESWRFSGRDKNTAYGPLAGHVFEGDGTCAQGVRRADGSVDDAPVSRKIEARHIEIERDG